jgi:UDP-4-amino-4,6-dideoxy-N-acetyl-beta-L-altrosamine N-acetyltransferase
MPLRLLTETDLPLVLGWRNAPEVRECMFTTHKITNSEHQTWFENNQTDLTTLWYIHENRDNQPDGVVGFTEYDNIKHTASWGFYLGNNSQKGSGLRLGIDALNEAFGKLKLQKLNAEVLGSNNKSLSFHRKLGFEQIGLFSLDHFNGEEYIDVFHFVMTPTTWKKIQIELNKTLTEKI